MLRRWLRDVESLSDTEEDIVYFCELGDGESLSEEEEEISFEDIAYFYEGNEKILFKDLVECQEDKKENLDFQVGKEKEMRLLESLENLFRSLYQQGVLNEMKKMILFESLKNSERSSYHQGVLTNKKDDEMRLSKSLRNSEESLDQLGMMTREEDQKCIPIIGGIRIFLPCIPIKVGMTITCEEVM
jgi:hypothetical protein